jgi:hypothetical protein
MLSRLKSWIVEQAFKQCFEAYALPFKKADEKIMQMNDNQRAEYLLMAKAWSENTTFQAEMDEALRKHYAALALESKNVADIQAHRLSILFLKDFKKRAAFLAASYKPPHMPSQFKR